MKSTAVAPSNIAFIKYWGKKNDVLRLPANGSISMNLSALTTTTTVEFLPTLTEDDITIDELKIEKESKRVSTHLDRIRKLASIQTFARVISKNSFPTSTGLSSSASGFAALTVAGADAAGLKLSEKELSILARLGSGSACRSIPDGFVEWMEGDTNETSYAKTIFPPEYFDIVDIVILTDSGKKDIPTTKGMETTSTSPFYGTRLQSMNKKINDCKTFIKNKDFTAFGTLIEQEALNMHAVMMTSNPSLLYWTQSTISIMKEVQKWRKEGIEAYFTINTGQDVHIICQKNDVNTLITNIKNLPSVVRTITNNPTVGTQIIQTHLF